MDTVFFCHLAQWPRTEAVGLGRHECRWGVSFSTCSTTSSWTKDRYSFTSSAFNPPLFDLRPRLSRPAGFHHRPLAEPDVNLSAHPAPIKQQTPQSNNLSVCLSHASKSSCFQLPPSSDRLTRPLPSRPITTLPPY